MKKICFITTFIGNDEDLDLPIDTNLKKNINYDYILFTNIDKEKINNNFWNIINIDKKYFIDNNIKNNVKISRYFKFSAHNYFKNVLNKNYEYIFYCDCHIYPNLNADWNNLCVLIDDNKLKFIQSKHKRYEYGIDADFNAILNINKETKLNIQETKEFLKKIDSNVDFKYPQYFQNTFFGYNLNDLVTTNFLDSFWKYYVDCPTYRDQPLWNFLLLHYNYKPAILNTPNNFFIITQKKERNINIYYKNV